VGDSFDKLVINNADFPMYKEINLCLTEGNKCKGGSGLGVSNTTPNTYTGYFRLQATTPPSNQLATQLSFTNFAVRYQSLTFGSGSGVGLGTTIDEQTGTVVPAVPEPAQWLTLIAGFGLIGGAMRRRTQSLGRAPRAA
jgi:hypothetical protein